MVGVTPEPRSNRTDETPRPRTYREIARVVGRSPSTVWRRLNRGRDVTRTEADRELRFAMVLSSRRQGLSIRRIASKLAISRSAVERDLQLARRLAEQGFDVVELARRAVLAALAAQTETGR